MCGRVEGRDLSVCQLETGEFFSVWGSSDASVKQRGPRGTHPGIRLIDFAKGDLS